MADIAKRDQDDQGFGTQLPGTGGDYIDTADVEGHVLRRDDGGTGLYNPGPTTQGEIVHRGPGDNPHGDR